MATFESIYHKEFKHLEVIGYGAFGVVCKAKNIFDNMEYAVKRIQFKNEFEKKKIEGEIKSLAQFSKCPHTVGYNRVWYETVLFKWQLEQDDQHEINNLTRTGPNIEFCYVQMELCDESLENWLKNKLDRDKVESLKIFKQVIEGICFIHKNKVVHRDLKPANILFAKTTEDLRVRIADFGLSRHVDSFTATAAGTMLYMAPEMTIGEFYPKSDIYSAGLILLELLYNCSGDVKNVLNNAKKNKFPPEFESTMNFAVPTLQKMLSSNVNDRPSSEEVLQILTTSSDWNEELQFATKKKTNISTKNKDATSQQNEELQAAAGRLRGQHLSEEEDFSSKEEWQLVSACSSEKHSLQRVGRWTTDATLSWSGEEGDSDSIPLPNAASSNTGWEVGFLHCLDDLEVFVSCTSLDSQFRAAAVRLVAVVEGAPQVWGEAADVMQSGQQSWWWCSFCKKVSECPKVRPLKVRVTVQWTELEHLPPTPDLWMESAARIRCSWQLRGWKVVTSTAMWWSLWSEPFGRSGALWRIQVVHYRNGGKRVLEVWVCLQHLPALVEWSGMSWKCSLTAWSRQFGEQQENMERESYCRWWTVVEDVDVETRDPLDLVVVIHVSRK